VAGARSQKRAAVELITVLAHDLGTISTPLKGRLDHASGALRKDASTTVSVDAASVAVGRLH